MSRSSGGSCQSVIKQGAAMQQIRIICDNCRVDMLEIVGTGMAGIEYLVCVCDKCRSFEKRNHSGPLEGKPRPKFRCGSCRKHLRVFAPFIDNSFYEPDLPRDESRDRCPVCGGRITIIDYQIEMD